MTNYIHICNNFIGNKIHSEVIRKFASSDINNYHLILVPYTDKKLLKNNYFKAQNAHIEYIYVNRFLRFFPFTKSIFILITLLKSVKKHNIATSHSQCIGYTFWSDGIQCFYLNLLFKTPYALFIRGTDINVFLKYGFHLRPLFKSIYNSSVKICFPSKSIESSFDKFNFLNIRKTKHSLVINPINDFWYVNAHYFNNLAIKKKKIIFVGSFDLNKNLQAVLDGCKALRKIREDFSLEFIGGNIQQFMKICKVTSVPDWVTITEKLTKDELLPKYRLSNILIVPSFQETLGMVYLEAISQGCIAIHSRNQGIDGVFPNETISYSVDPHNYQNIANTLNITLDKDLIITSSELKKLLKPFTQDNTIKNYYNFFD